MEPPSTVSITVLNQSGRSLDTTQIEQAVRESLAVHGFPAAEVNVLLGDDDVVQQMNAQFRGINQVTDVLTFVDTPGNGEIAIAVPYAERQAAIRRVTLGEELAYLAIHGALHLAGLDDESDLDRLEMMRAMNVIAVRVGLPSDESWCSLLHDEDVVGAA